MAVETTASVENAVVVIDTATRLGTASIVVNGKHSSATTELGQATNQTLLPVNTGRKEGDGGDSKQFGKHSSSGQTSVASADKPDDGKSLSKVNALVNWRASDAYPVDRTHDAQEFETPIGNVTRQNLSTGHDQADQRKHLTYISESLVCDKECIGAHRSSSSLKTSWSLPPSVQRSNQDHINVALPRSTEFHGIIRLALDNLISSPFEEADPLDYFLPFAYETQHSFLQASFIQFYCTPAFRRDISPHARLSQYRLFDSNSSYQSAFVKASGDPLVLSDSTPNPDNSCRVPRILSPILEGQSGSQCAESMSSTHAGRSRAYRHPRTTASYATYFGSGDDALLHNSTSIRAASWQDKEFEAAMNMHRSHHSLDGKFKWKLSRDPRWPINPSLDASRTQVSPVYPGSRSYRRQGVKERNNSHLDDYEDETKLALTSYQAASWKPLFGKRSNFRDFKSLLTSSFERENTGSLQQHESLSYKMAESYGKFTSKYLQAKSDNWSNLQGNNDPGQKDRRNCYTLPLRSPSTTLPENRRFSLATYSTSRRRPPSVTSDHLSALLPRGSRKLSRSSEYLLHPSDDNRPGLTNFLSKSTSMQTLRAKLAAAHSESFLDEMDEMDDLHGLRYHNISESLETLQLRRQVEKQHRQLLQTLLADSTSNPPRWMSGEPTLPALQTQAEVGMCSGEGEYSLNPQMLMSGQPVDVATFEDQYSNCLLFNSTGARPIFSTAALRNQSRSVGHYLPEELNSTAALQPAIHSQQPVASNSPSFGWQLTEPISEPTPDKSSDYASQVNVSDILTALGTDPELLQTIVANPLMANQLMSHLCIDGQVDLTDPVALAAMAGAVAATTMVNAGLLSGDSTQLEGGNHQGIVNNPQLSPGKGFDAYPCGEQWTSRSVEMNPEDRHLQNLLGRLQAVPTVECQVDQGQTGLCPQNYENINDSGDLRPQEQQKPVNEQEPVTHQKRHPDVVAQRDLLSSARTIEVQHSPVDRDNTLTGGRLQNTVLEQGPREAIDSWLAPSFDRFEQNVQQNNGMPECQKWPQLQPVTPSKNRCMPLQTKQVYDFPTKRLLIMSDSKLKNRRAWAESNGTSMRIVGGHIRPDGKLGAFVEEIYATGPVDQLHGEICEGDEILEWNSISLVGKAFEEVQAIVEQPAEEIELVVRLRRSENGCAAREKISSARQSTPTTVDSRLIPKRVDALCHHHAAQQALMSLQQQQQPAPCPHMRYYCYSTPARGLPGSMDWRQTTTTSPSSSPSSGSSSGHVTVESTRTSLPDSRTVAKVRSPDADLTSIDDGTQDKSNWQTTQSAVTTGAPAGPKPNYGDTAAMTPKGLARGSERIPTGLRMQQPSKEYRNQEKMLDEFEQRTPTYPMKTTKSPNKLEEIEDYGELELMLTFDDYDQSLTVHVARARNLQAMDLNGLADPFVKLRLHPDPAEDPDFNRQTKYMANTLTPEWQQTLVFMNCFKRTLKRRLLEVTLWDFDRLKTNDFMGQTLINLGDKHLLDGRPHWFKLHKMQPVIPVARKTPPSVRGPATTANSQRLQKNHLS